ncbi:MAG: hypothetical protein U0350_05540 [Caldilineaceae bacterium]
MAGYIFSLDSISSLALYTNSGVYATKLSAPSGIWMVHHEGTFADYATMQAGDNVYFFIQRKIYGIGKLINIEGDCKFFNFPNAGTPSIFDYAKVKNELLWDEGEVSVRQRCVCFFEPDPYFFQLGIDMDDVLASNPVAFKMLRAFWKLSFIKFDDEENQAFRNIILKRNQSVLVNPLSNTNTFSFHPQHARIAQLLRTGNYKLSTGLMTMLSSCAIYNALNHEMAIEAGILHQLANKDQATGHIFGQWDYLSHQVIASPFKPIDYMDKMDMFGYSYIPGFRPTRAQFLVGEIKKNAAKLEDIDQLLKYVDWVRDEYSFGDYSTICAFLVAYEFSDNVIQHKKRVGIRKYTSGFRPAQSLEWNNVKLVKYTFDATIKKLNFTFIGE